MKILHLMGGGDVGGAKTHILSLTGELSKENDVKLISFRPGECEQIARGRGMDTLVIHSKNVIADFFKLRRAVRDFAPDVIHSHGAKANMMGALVKIFMKKTVVTTIHSDYRLDYLGRPFRQHTFGAVNAAALRVIRYKIAVADHFAQMLITRGFDPEMIYTLYNGLDFSGATGEKTIDRKAYFESVGLPYEEGDVVVGIAARLTPVKDIPTLIRAFALASRRNPRLKLLVAGDGEERDRLMQLASERGLDGRAAFAGWISDTRSFFQAIDINTLTSISESFPYSILEGTREGCALVSTRVGGVPDLVDHGENGFIVEPGDAASLAEYLYILSMDDEMRKKFARLLFLKAASQFSLDSMRRTQQQIYEKVLRREQNREKRRGAVICGAYGRGNAGDESILKSIVAQLRALDPEMPLCVLSRRPEETRLSHRVNAIYTFRADLLWRRLRRAKLYINGGGSLMQDVTSNRSLYFYLYTLHAAKKAGCRVMMYGCGIGPIDKPFNRERTARVLNRSVDTITLRDDISKTELARLGVTGPKIVLAADPALNIAPAPGERADEYLRAQGVPPDGRYILFALRPWKGIDRIAPALAEAADYAYQTYRLVPLFLPIEMPRDLEFAETVASHVSCPHYVVTTQRPPEVTVAILKRMQAVAAMRLHALIFSVCQDVPVIALSYDVKVDGFMRYIQSDACIPVDRFSLDAFKEQLDAVFSDPSGTKTARRGELLRQWEQNNAKEAEKLLFDRAKPCRGEETP